MIIMYCFQSYQGKHLNFESVLKFLPDFTCFMMHSKAKSVRLKVCVRLWVNLPYLMLGKEEVIVLYKRKAHNLVVKKEGDLLHNLRYFGLGEQSKE